MLTSRLAGRVLGAAAVGLLAFVLSAPTPSLGQDKGKQPDFIPADYDDYQNMLDQLGIKKMRKGRDARVKDTSDEATASKRARRINRMSPTVIPGAGSNKYASGKPARTVVAVRCASIRIIRIVSVSANRSSRHITATHANSDSHSDHDRSLRIRKRHSQ